MTSRRPTALRVTSRQRSQLVQGVNNGERYQTLLGDGHGKTFTMANVIAQTGRPALVLARQHGGAAL